MSSIRLDAFTQPEELAYIHLLVVCWRYLCKALDLRQVCSSQQATPLFESPDQPRMLRTWVLDALCTWLWWDPPLGIPTLWYATRVCSPQSIDLIKRTERIQRRATKFILNLPYMFSETYKERLVLSNLIPISYWHEYLDVLFYFKSINKHVFLSENTIPTRLNHPGQQDQSKVQT